MRVGLFTNSTFNGIPPLKYLIGHFFSLSKNKVHLFHNEVKGVSVFPEKQTVIHSLAVFDTTSAMLFQSLPTKIKRHLKLLRNIISFQVANKNSLLYCIDMPTCNLLLLSRLFFFYRRNKIIYHQFEMYDPERANSFDKLNFWLFKKLRGGLDLVIIPEQNRLQYLKEAVNLSDRIKAFILPNTNSSQANFIPTANRLTNKNNIVIGHIGSLGAEQHFIREYIQILKKLPANFSSLFVGRITPEVKNMLNELGDRVKIVDHVMQEELQAVYASIDLGIILYHPYELNTRYAAPTKMYEYWSSGIPVIAHQLISLQPLFTNTEQGILTDMSSPEIFYKDLITISANLPQWDRSELRSYFRKHFELDSFLSQFDAAIREII